MTNIHPDILAVLKATDLPEGGVLVHAEWELVHDSPFQYRKTYSETGLDGLAQNIRETGGIHEPLLARRRFPNKLRTHYEPENGFEIIAGHRRKIAGIRAQLATGPLLVKDMTDDQVRKIQLTENVQREDVHAIEEAEGFQQLIDHHGETADTLAVLLGKSRSHVYARLALLRACPQVRQACLSGDIKPEVALLLARLRTEKLQTKALGYIEGKNYKLSDGGTRSLRDVRELLKERFTLNLKQTIFDSTDALLLPDAGACTTCPKRTANAPEYEDLLKDGKSPWGQPIKGSPDLCTDPDCFAEKKTAHLRNEAAKLESKGQVVVDGNKARNAIGADGVVKGAYIALKDVQEMLKKRPKTSLAGNVLEAPEVVTIQDPRTGKTVKAVKREDLKAAGVKVAEPKPRPSGDDWREQQRKRAEEHERESAKAKAEGAVRLAMLQRVRTAAAALPRSALDLQLVAHVAFAGVDYQDRAVLAQLYGGGSRDDLHKKIGSMNATEVALFALDCALIQDIATHTGNYKTMPKPLVSAAKHYGVDLEAVRAELQAPADDASTPSTAARAPKKAKADASKKVATKAAPAAKTAKGKKKGEEQKVDAGVAGGSDGQAELIEEAGA